MIMRTLTARARLVFALACCAALTLLVTLENFSVVLLARIAIGGAALGVLLWFSGRTRREDSMPNRLEVIQRVGLTQRTAVALVEVDGQSYLIVHGDGFARMRPTRRPTAVLRQYRGLLS